jgi:hypothetical protein
MPSVLVRYEMSNSDVVQRWLRCGAYAVPVTEVLIHGDQSALG